MAVVVVTDEVVAISSVVVDDSVAELSLDDEADVPLHAARTDVLKARLMKARRKRIGSESNGDRPDCQCTQH